MIGIPKIDQIARIRRDEINREILEWSRKRRGVSCVQHPDGSHLDLNIRLVLQPRLSLSIWFRRGAR
jgi:hypothetical protein